MLNKNMERWSGRVAVVTGAGSGIGAATAKHLVKYGLKVVGFDNMNHLKIEDMSRELKNEPGKLYAHKTDVTKEEEVVESFEIIKKTLGGVDILVNCAGVYYSQHSSEFNVNAARQTFDVNVIGLCVCTREALKSMKERGVDDGHIIHIASIAAHILPLHTSQTLYTSSKHAVRVYVEGLRKELADIQSRIRITCISPGYVKTNMLQNATPEWEKILMLKPEDIAEAVTYALSRPSNVQVYQLIVLPVVGITSKM